MIYMQHFRISSYTDLVADSSKVIGRASFTNGFQLMRRSFLAYKTQFK